MEFLTIIIYAQPSRANRPHGRNWITTLAVNAGDADKEKVARAIYLAARMVVAQTARLELHHAGTIERLPQGKSPAAPDWSGDGVKAWNCPMLGDLAPAVKEEAPSSLREEPRYGYRHEEERHR